MNPFKNRNSYPGLDAVFAKGNDNSGIDFNHEHEHEHISSPDRSSSIIPPSDILNMSIGARAAIFEQTRQITKYGLDGDGSGISPTKSTSQNNASDEWDRLMDRTQDNTSMIGSMSLSQCQSNCSFSFMRGMGSVAENGLSANALDENQTLDLTYDQSDYFNSSKVLHLRTPEKNKAKVDEASRLARLGFGESLQNRGNVSVNESVSGSTSGELEQSGMIGLFSAAMKLGAYQDEDDDINGNNDHLDDGAATESFISYHEPNMSVINLNLTSTGMHTSMSEESAVDFFSRGDQRIEAGLEDEGLNVGNDLQASFISYRDPELSMISHRGGNQTPSEFGRSEFDVDVSEIIAPSEFEKGPYSSPYRKTLDERFPISPNSCEIMKHSAEEPLFSPCTTPIRARNVNPVSTPPPEVSKSKFNGHYSPADKIGWPSASPSPTNFHSSTTDHSRGIKDRARDNSVEIPTAYRSRRHSENDSSLVASNILMIENRVKKSYAMPGTEYPISHRTRTTAETQSSRHLEDYGYLGGNIKVTAEFHNSVTSQKAHSSPKQISRGITIERINDNVDGSDCANQCQTPPSPGKGRQLDPLMLKSNVSFISPIGRQYSSGETMHNSKGVYVKQTSIQSKLSPLSPLSLNGRQQSKMINREATSVSKTQSRSWEPSNRSKLVMGSRSPKHSSHIPQRMSLRDRYSQPDRFEDSYSVPSSASTLNSSPRTVNDEQSLSVNRSLLDTFRFVA